MDPLSATTLVSKPLIQPATLADISASLSNPANFTIEEGVANPSSSPLHSLTNSSLSASPIISSASSVGSPQNYPTSPPLGSLSNSPSQQGQTTSSSVGNKKPSPTASSDEIQTHHAHIDDEHVIESDPSGKYGKLNIILGKGAYKVVWKAIDFRDGFEVAWNCFQTSKQESTEFSQEIEILKQVRHPNIITFRDAWYNNGEFVFITELITSGTLREYIQKLKKPDLKIVRSWARQILNGLLYLHSHNPPIIHRDIKCDNIFINGAHGEVKIGDMGTAKMKVGKKYTVIGTPEFMAPEMYEERGYSEKVDIYAFGMCLLEMVTAEYPYSECKNAAQIYKKVSSGIKPECLTRVEDGIVLALIQECIAPETERINVREILEHPFFSSEPELILLGVDEIRLKLVLQVMLRYPEFTSFKFEYDLETDTSENVVSEMVQEQVIPELFRNHLTALLNKQIRNFHQTFPFAMIKKNQYVSKRVLQSEKSEPNAITVTDVTSNNGKSSGASSPPIVTEGFPDSSTEAITEPSLSHTKSVASRHTTMSLTHPPELIPNWKREAQYKAELTSVQKEMLNAVERAIIAEKRASETEKLIAVSETKRQDTDLLVESLKAQIYALKQASVNPSCETRKSPLSTTVLEQSFSPSFPEKRSSSPVIITAEAPLVPQLSESPLHASSSTQAQASFTQPASGNTSCNNIISGSSNSTSVPITHSSSVGGHSTSYGGTVPSISAASPNFNFPDNMSIEDLVSEVALVSQRSPDKAYEWAIKLQTQDILTVGDLRQLHDADWANLNLTVFAMRALKNAISRRPSISTKPLGGPCSTPVPASTTQSVNTPCSANPHHNIPVPPCPNHELNNNPLSQNGDLLTVTSSVSQNPAIPSTYTSFHAEDEIHKTEAILSPTPSTPSPHSVLCGTISHSYQGAIAQYEYNDDYGSQNESFE